MNTPTPPASGTPVVTTPTPEPQATVTSTPEEPCPCAPTPTSTATTTPEPIPTPGGGEPVCYVEIKGTLYTAGAARIINCTKAGRNILDSRFFFSRTFPIVPSCPLFPYTKAGVLRFDGTDETMFKNGVATRKAIFVGMGEGATLPPVPGALVDDVVHGVVNSILKSRTNWFTPAKSARFTSPIRWRPRAWRSWVASAARSRDRSTDSRCLPGKGEPVLRS